MKLGFSKIDFESDAVSATRSLEYAIEHEENTWNKMLTAQFYQLLASESKEDVAAAVNHLRASLDGIEADNASRPDVVGCLTCGQIEDIGHGEFVCPTCGLPTVEDLLPSDAETVVDISHLREPLTPGRIEAMSRVNNFVADVIPGEDDSEDGLRCPHGRRMDGVDNAVYRCAKCRAAENDSTVTLPGELCLRDR